MLRRKTATPRGVLKGAAADNQGMEHARYHPSADLAPYVEHFWAVRWDLHALAGRRVETLPHPSVHMVFERDAGGTIAGVAHGKFVRQLHGTGGVFAAKFRPGGFHPFARISMVNFTDQVLPLASVWGVLGQDLELAVRVAPDDAARAEIIERFLRDRSPEPDENAALVTTIVESVAVDRTIVTVGDVSRRWGLNARKLQRLFAEYVGVSPKWVIQRYRLHEAVERSARGPVNQATIALDLGYTDQAHFVNDFKATVGTTPAAYAKRPAST
ncbi:MAG: helix-turn-helix transcriptional regulator [bacterium]